jgi:hypothetical protein
MISPYRPTHATTNEYIGSPVEIDLLHPGRPGAIAGIAKRCGVTAPRFHCRATYRIQAGTAIEHVEYEPGVYVLDNNQLVESHAWHEAEYNAGRWPVVEEAPKKRGKK